MGPKGPLFRGSMENVNMFANIYAEIVDKNKFWRVFLRSARYIQVHSMFIDLKYPLMYSLYEEE